MSDGALSTALHSAADAKGVGKRFNFKAARDFSKRFKSFRLCLQSLHEGGLLVLTGGVGGGSGGGLFVSATTATAQDGQEDEGSVLSQCSPECLALLRRTPSPEFYCGSFLLAPDEAGFVNLAMPCCPPSSPLPSPLPSPCDPPAQEWWRLCDVAFAASLLFSPEMMHALSAQVAQMAPGSVFISLKALPEDSAGHAHCSLARKSFFKMSWQQAEVFVYIVSLPP